MKPLHSLIIGFVAGLILFVCIAAAPHPVSISGSLVWTNSAGLAITVSNGLAVGIGTNAQSDFNSQSLIVDDTPHAGGDLVTINSIVDTNVPGDGLSVNLTSIANGIIPGSPGSLALPALNGTTRLSLAAGGSVYFGDGTMGVFGGGGANTSTSTNGVVGVYGKVFGREGLLVGTIGESDAKINGSTNYGVIGHSVKGGTTGQFIGGYFEIANNIVGDGTDDPKAETAVVILDNRDSGSDLQYWRTNNGSHVARIDKNGILMANSLISNSGLLIHSNTLASIPILSNGDTYYWSSNGVAYVICSSPSGTLTTNKLGP